MQHILTCRCGEVVIKSANGAVKIRNKMMVFRDGTAHAVCKGCGLEVPVPVELKKALIEVQGGNPRLFLRDPK
jgi:hypothetical protein